MCGGISHNSTHVNFASPAQRSPDHPLHAGVVCLVSRGSDSLAAGATADPDADLLRCGHDDGGDGQRG